MGVLCGTCTIGYHNSGMTCNACVGATQYSIVFVILGAVAAVALFVYIARHMDTTKLVNVAKVLVSYFQVTRGESARTR